MTMKDKIVVVTGGTDGIGKVTARELAALGAHVTIIGRNAAKGDTVLRELRAQTGNEHVDFLLADLSTRRGVLQAGSALNERFGHIDVLVNNAGAIFQTRQLSADGIEMTLALNHLGYFHLTSQVIGLLKEADQGRVVNVASAAHVGAKLDLSDLQVEHNYSGWTAYSRSKLANIHFTHELARRLEGTRVTANCLHPGFVASSFGNNNGGFFGFVFGLAKRVGAIPESEGAKTSLHLAMAPELKLVNGKYFDKCKEVRSSPASYDEAVERELWERSEVLCGSPFK